VKKTNDEAIYLISDDPRVNGLRILARQLRHDVALTPELQEAISDLNAEACKNFNRNQPKEPKRHA
jgi:hypothetical protein